MAIDASIYRGIQPMQIEPRMNALMRATQLQGMEQNNALRDAQMQELQQRAAMALKQQQEAAALKAKQDEVLSGLRGGAKFDPYAALQAGMPKELIELLAKAPDLGRPKVARTAEIAGPDGRPVTVQLDEYGRPVGDGMPKPVERKLVNTGGAQTPYDPYNLTAPLPMTMAPGEQERLKLTEAAQRDASARGWAGINIQRQAEARQADAAKGGAKAPTGYRFKDDGSLEAIPGGPADIKAGEAGAKADQKRQFSVKQAETVLSTIQEAKGKVGFWTSGFGAESLAGVGGTGARDLKAKLETVKANLGFDRLQQMRDTSPTGGALGQVAVQELVALQSTVASLDQAQSPEQLKAALDRVERHYRNWLNVMRQAGGEQAPAPQTVDPGVPVDISDIMKKYGK